MFHYLSDKEKQQWHKLAWADLPFFKVEVIWVNGLESYGLTEAIETLRTAE